MTFSADTSGPSPPSASSTSSTPKTCCQRITSLRIAQLKLNLQLRICGNSDDFVAVRKHIADRLQLVDVELEEQQRSQRDLKSLEEGGGDKSLLSASCSLVQSMIARSWSQWSMTSFLKQLQHMGSARRRRVLASMSRDREELTARENESSKDSRDSLVVFSSSFSSSSFTASSFVPQLSANDRQLKFELEVLRGELNIEEKPDDNDGYKFDRSVYNLVLSHTENTNLVFEHLKKRLATNRVNKTWRVKAEEKRQKLFPSYLQRSSTSADIKNVGEEIDVDIRINSPLYAVLNLSQPSAMGAALKQIAATHNSRLNECLKNPIVAHFVKSQIDMEVFGRNSVELNPEYLKKQLATWTAMLRSWENDKFEDINLDQQEWRTMIADYHEFHVDENGVVHSHDKEGYDVIYEDTVDLFYKLETRLLLIATHYIRMAETECLPDKVRCLHSAFTCELAFQEAKLNLIVALLDTFHHCVDVDDLREIIQKIVDLIHLQVPISLSSPFITSAYNLQISTLKKKTELLEGLMVNIRNDQRLYSKQLSSLFSPDFSTSGLPLPVFTISQAMTARISSLHVHRILSTQPVSHHILGELCSSLSRVHTCLDVCDYVADDIVTGLSCSTGLVWLSAAKNVTQEACDLLKTCVESSTKSWIQRVEFADNPFVVVQVLEAAILGDRNKNLPIAQRQFVHAKRMVDIISTRSCLCCCLASF
ncbi:hypothetical protein GUITHDRAFT_121889 [Guillardia theta CCMP2712]|uniref:Uncharacterized protein n=1 Tax=Guillardia theta (strain CCMP2712) TaxID=905079 RepID=L1I7R4_GUITC|nr:hypothetical protein GUITHDRAFT_121889 [Guillardia theta CCMP2712]EKX31939.1 hypothetical protein GUITHDRAFT_121889 [Guillardia theta CCMP2712]|eukprot:XP_005818919.1 hypothetical protein GUITHDRAFT_121889 [Guillardia theta CCMP2712]